jgi:hypothetical protein
MAGTALTTPTKDTLADAYWKIQWKIATISPLCGMKMTIISTMTGILAPSARTQTKKPKAKLRVAVVAKTRTFLRKGLDNACPLCYNKYVIKGQEFQKKGK